MLNPQICMIIAVYHALITSSVGLPKIILFDGVLRGVPCFKLLQAGKPCAVGHSSLFVEFR